MVRQSCWLASREVTTVVTITTSTAPATVHIQGEKEQGPTAAAAATPALDRGDFPASLAAAPRAPAVRTTRQL